MNIKTIHCFCSQATNSTDLCSHCLNINEFTIKLPIWILVCILIVLFLYSIGCFIKKKGEEIAIKD